MMIKLQWNLYKADTFRTYPRWGWGGRFIEGVRLIEVLKIAQCLLTINIQRLLFTVIKFYVVKEAVLYFDLCKTLRRTLIADDNHTAWYWPNLQFLTAKCIDLSLILDYSTYFMDVIQYYSVLSIQSGVYLMEVFNYRNLFQCPRPLNRGIRWIGVRYKGKYKTLISETGLVFA